MFRNIVTRSLAASALALAIPTLALAPRGAAAAPLPANCTRAGTTVTCTYASTGAEQTFAVPAGVSSVLVTAVGAAGATAGANDPGAGGRGAEVTGTVDQLVSGEILYVEVGGVPTGGGAASWTPGACGPPGMPGPDCIGGFNGGGMATAALAGGGGGASDVRTSPRTAPHSLSTRRMVAAGGGGGGFVGFNCAPGSPGGDAGAAGGSESCPGAGEPGTGETAGGGGGGGSSLVPAGGSVVLSNAPPSITIRYTIPTMTPSPSPTPKPTTPATPAPPTPAPPGTAPGLPNTGVATPWFDVTVPSPGRSPNAWEA